MEQINQESVDKLKEEELYKLVHFLKEDIKRRSANISLQEPRIQFVYSIENDSMIDFLMYQIYVLQQVIEGFPSFS